MTSTNTTNPHPLHPHLFLAGAQVSSREHRDQRRAARAGVTTLAGYHAWRTADRTVTA